MARVPGLALGAARAGPCVVSTSSYAFLFILWVPHSTWCLSPSIDVNVFVLAAKSNVLSVIPRVVRQPLQPLVLKCAVKSE